MASKQEREHYQKMASIGCILCTHLGYSETPAELHHIRNGNTRRSHAPVIPLCPNHHRFGPDGFHFLGRRAFERKFGLTQEHLLQMALAKLC
jgi:hypothetical protein